MRWIRRYFGYSRGEARGLVVVLAIMLGAVVAPMLLRPELPAYLPAADQQGLDRLAAQLKEPSHPRTGLCHALPQAGYRKFERKGARYPTVARIPLAPFDPNTLSAEGWEARGVPHFVAARIVKYGAAAGGFKAKAQIKKMYGLEDSVYQRLAPFMQLPDEAPRARLRRQPAGPGWQVPALRRRAAPGKFPRKPRNLQPFDLNTRPTPRS